MKKHEVRQNFVIV